MKRLALLLVLILSLNLFGCNGTTAPSTVQTMPPITENVTTAPVESYGVRVDEQVLISQVEPADGSEVCLISDYSKSFLTDYYFGKGPHTVSYKNDVMTKKGPMHRNLTFSWTCTAENTGYTLIYATMPDFSDRKAVETEKSQVEVAGLYIASSYYWQVITHTADRDNYSPVYSFTTEDTTRIIALDGADNTRDLGGYLTADGKFRVRQGMIYRGSNLDEITGKGMKQAVELYGIRTDLDLRSPTSETDHMLYKDRSPILMGEINYINISGVSYSSALPYSDRVANELRVFAQRENYPIYFHCKAGRDRAGTLAFLLNALLGVPEQTLLADYELTYLSPRAYANGDMRGHNWMMEFLAGFKSLPGDTLREKAESYCLGSGMTQEEIDTIRDIMLTPVN